MVQTLLYISGNAARSVGAPQTETTIYVDAAAGDDANKGLTEETAVKTLRRAMNLAGSKTKIVVKNGTYTNNNYGSGDSNGAVMNIKSKTDILITNKPGHSPLVKFDGSGGIVMSNVEIKL